MTQAEASEPKRREVLKLEAENIRNMLFELHAHRWKVKGGYIGPCEIRGFAVTAAGDVRYVVAYRIAGGQGDILHIQAPHELSEYELDYLAEVERRNNAEKKKEQRK